MDFFGGIFIFAGVNWFYTYFKNATDDDDETKPEAKNLLWSVLAIIIGSVAIFLSRELYKRTKESDTIALVNASDVFF